MVLTDYRYYYILLPFLVLYYFSGIASLYLVTQTSRNSNHAFITRPECTSIILYSICQRIVHSAVRQNILLYRIEFSFPAWSLTYFLQLSCHPLLCVLSQNNYRKRLSWSFRARSPPQHHMDTLLPYSNFTYKSESRAISMLKSAQRTWTCSKCWDKRTLELIKM